MEITDYRVAHHLRDEIDKVCVREGESSPRSHLGASEIGHKCERFLQLKFRRCDIAQHSGRVLRLFKRGEREESIVKDYLEKIGCEFKSYKDDCLISSKNNQFKFSNLGGFYGGSCDGILKLPEMVVVNPITKETQNFPQSEYTLWECKTLGDRSESKLLFETGVEATKNQHYCQMMVYCYEFGLTHALYTSVNKWNDDIYIEIVKCNHALGDKLAFKAEKIITSEVLLKKVSEYKNYPGCSYCDMKDVCKNNKKAIVNCYSCINNTPCTYSGDWKCNQYDKNIPVKAMQDSSKCKHYKSILTHWKEIK